MGAIVDANVADEVFGSNRSEAGKQFFDWIDAGKGVLMVGGGILQEFDKTSFRKRRIKEWMRQAVLAGNVREFKDPKINKLKTKLLGEKKCRSDDPHILALAQVSGARLLYSNDKKLQQDFKNKELIDQPRGKIYPTNNEDKKFQKKHKKLLLQLENKQLCGVIP